MDPTPADLAAQLVDLVASGPGQGTRHTGVVVDELFRGARRSVLVVGFAVHDGRQVFAALAERMDADPALDVTCCFDVSRGPGDTSRDEDVLGRFARRFVTQDWPGKRLPNVYCDRRALAPYRRGEGRAVLHAKAIAVDDERVLVTSANLTSAAQTRNVELGLLVRVPTVAAAVRRYFEQLIDDGVLTPVPLPRRRT